MNRQIQCLVGYKTLQSSVFLLQLLEAPSLIHLHTTVLLAPPVVGLFADAKLTNRLGDRFALTGPYLCLTKVPDDLLCGVTLLDMLSPCCVPNPNSGNGDIPGGQVIENRGFALAVPDLAIDLFISEPES